jgi:hypothetical protein
MLMVDAGTDAYVMPMPDSGPVCYIGLSLASGTPPGRTTGLNETGLHLTTFDLESVCARDVTITEVIVHRSGIGAATDFSNLYLFEDTGHYARVTAGRTIDSVTDNAAMRFFDRGLVIPPYGRLTLWLIGDVSAVAAGGQHSFEITGSDAVLSDADFVTGRFPLVGNTFTVGTVSSAQLVIRPDGPLLDFAAGTYGPISQFTLTAVGGGLTFSRINLIQNGDADLRGMPIEATIDGVSVHAGADGNLLSVWSDVAFLLADGERATVTLFATPAVPPGSTIRTYVEYPADVQASDMRLGINAHVDTSAFDGHDASSRVELTVR